MLEQCLNAMTKFNTFVNYHVLKNKTQNIINQITNQEQLVCHDSVTCYYDGISEGDFWCENMDLYDCCVTIYKHEQC
jgi:hypothetical protein